MQVAQFDHWWPVTYDFGLVRSDVETVHTMRSRQYADHDIAVVSEWLDAPLQACFASLEPLSLPSRKELFLSITFGWTAFFQNGFRGSDPFLPMFQLSRALGVTALRACVTPRGARYQGVILEVYDTPEAGGDEWGYRRSVAAVNDGGRWVFEQSGRPFDCEDTAQYGARRKRDRFTAEVLWNILGNFGIPKMTDETLQPGGTSRGALLSRPALPNVPVHSLAEAKALDR